MTKELAKAYEPRDVEDRIYDFWMQGGYFHAEVDEKKRNELYREVQMILWKEVPVAFLVYEDNTAASNKHLKNFNPLPDTGFEFYSAEWVD